MKSAPDTKWRKSMAYAPRVVVSMLLALAVFAVVTYLATGSLATAAIQTALCAVLIQIGYFLTLLYLVWKTAKARKAEADAGPRGQRDLDQVQPKLPVSSMSKPGHSKF